MLVTGGSGQLATALAEAGGARVVRIGRPVFDFDDPRGVERLFARMAPAMVVNAAAYTAVDAAETDATAAYRVNRDGPALLARICEQAGIPLIQVSTDYVFDGTKGAPYIETDATAPLGVYGASKLDGERAVLDACSRAVVLRTSWLYGVGGRNFVRTMLSAAHKADRLRVVADQIGCPTYAADLADAILAISTRIRGEGWQAAFHGVFHAAGAGSTSWHGLAVAAFKEAERCGLAAPQVLPITTSEWPTPVRRPADSRLNCDKVAAVFGWRMPEWQDALARAVPAMVSPMRGSPSSGLLER